MTESNDTAAAIAEPLPERMSWRDRVAPRWLGRVTIGLFVLFVVLFVVTG